MIEAGICICGFLVLGGIIKYVSGEGGRYSVDYYNYLRNNKNTPERPFIDYSRYL